MASRLAYGFLAFVQAGPVEQRSAIPNGFYVPAYYPAPYGGWIESWAESYDKAKALVDEMTLAEKVNITSGTGIFMGKHESQLSKPAHRYVAC
jgi:beta-glucosidase